MVLKTTTMPHLIRICQSLVNYHHYVIILTNALLSCSMKGVEIIVTYSFEDFEDFEDFNL